MAEQKKTRIIILGGGFAGLHAAIHLDDQIAGPHTILESQCDRVDAERGGQAVHQAFDGVVAAIIAAAVVGIMVMLVLLKVIVASAAVEIVLAASAVQVIVAGTSSEQITPAASEQHVVVVVSVDDIASVAAI